jgi:hypothetical protein
MTPLPRSSRANAGRNSTVLGRDVSLSRADIPELWEVEQVDGLLRSGPPDLELGRPIGWEG